ncbi:MAG: sulfotransferase family 2 domain-containing protein [Rhodobacteraceae bacterium]|jgi:hypothetical protein|nr:sulfotransferase family 2 domain-containing protein [Paracoccaceae bacterium]
MHLSPRRGFVFVHIPKTGGTSLALALEARAAADDILIGDTPKARARRRRLAGVATAGRLWKHARLVDIEGLIGGETMARLLVFTLVRNPWDRAVSYYHWLRSQRFAHPAVGLARGLGFSAFLNHPHTRASLAAGGYGAYVADPAGVDRCGLWLRLERLADDLPLLEARLGLRLAPLPHANASDRPRDYRAAYSDADARLVARLAAADIARFGYAFDRPAPEGPPPPGAPPGWAPAPAPGDGQSG